MSNFKLAVFQKLRVETKKGLLSAEQLCDLSIGDLDDLAVSLEQEHKESGRKSFVVRSTPKDKTAKLKFDLVLEILETKVEEAEAARQALDDKEYNNKILDAIAGKEDIELKGKSVAQLRKMLRK